jgi:hypothetical protein
MTEGETRFYLREISSHWSTSNVSADKLAELEAACLIEMTPGPVQKVRLTHEGVRRKNLARPRQIAGGIDLTNPLRTARRYRPKTKSLRAKPLV